MNETKRGRGPARTANPLETAIELATNNTGYARREGDISIRTARHLNLLVAELATVGMPTDKRNIVDYLINRLRQDHAEQFDLDCKDLVQSYELSGCLRAAVAK